MDRVLTRRYENVFGSRHPIRYGDKIFARIVMRGRTIVEFVLNQVSDMTELLGELRKKVKGVQGLAKIYLRNYSRGWSLEKPLMLYTPQSSSSLRNHPNGTSAPFSSANSYSAASGGLSSSRMLFPWETH
ncbi:MAG: hypothetical protein K2G23_07450 [Muribaculaceae bacterium]|nr:hypothetical protein [Muribaculaceae bacterium]